MKREGMQMDKREQNEDFYQKIRKKLGGWAESPAGKKYKFSEILLTAPDLFYLLCKLSMDPKVPSKEKAKLAAAIAYFVSPVDMIPEIILGPIGYSDDIVVAACALNSIINHVDKSIVEKYWVGNQNILVLIQEILRVGTDLVGTKKFETIKNFLKK